MGNTTSDGLFGAYMIINITFIVTFRWLLRRKQRLREKKRQSLMRDGGMYGYYSDDDEEDNDSRDRGYDPGGDLDADGNYLEDRGFLQYVAPSKANKTRTGSEASFDRWVDRVQEVAPSGGGGSGSGFDGGLAPVPEGAEDLEAVRGSREDGGDEDMAVFVTTEPVEWRNERQEWEPATILEVKHMSDLKPFYTILLEKDQTEMGTAASCLRRSRDPNRRAAGGYPLETMSLDRPGNYPPHPHDDDDGNVGDGRARSYPRPPPGGSGDGHNGGQMGVRWADDVSGGDAHSVVSEVLSEDYDDDDHDPHSNAAVEEWYAERDRRRALKQERLDLLCDDCCGDFAWWEPAAWMGWALRLFAEALVLLPFIGCYLWSFWAERQADRRKAILAERKYGALGSDDESYSSFSSDGEWDSDFDDDDEENRGDEEAGTTNAQQPPHDSGAYDPEPIEGTSEYAMKIMGQGGGADAINPPSKRNSNRRSSGGNSSTGGGGTGGLSAKMAARKAERVAEAKRNSLNSNKLQKPPGADNDDGAGQRLMRKSGDRGDEEAGREGGGGNSVSSSKGGGGGAGRHYTGRHHSGGGGGGGGALGVHHLDEDLKRLEAEILVWGGDAAARAQQRLSGTSFGRSLQSGWEQGSTRSAANRRDSTPTNRAAGAPSAGAASAPSTAAAAGRRTSSPAHAHRGSGTSASSALVAHPASTVNGSSSGPSGPSGGRIASALRGESTRRTSNSGQPGTNRSNSSKAKRGSGNRSSGRGSNVWTQPPAASQSGSTLPRPPRPQQNDKAKALAKKYPVHLLNQAPSGGSNQGRPK